jgi:hypothetical protein
MKRGFQLLAHDPLLELVWGDSHAASIETVRGFRYRYRPSPA